MVQQLSFKAKMKETVWLFVLESGKAQPGISSPNTQENIKWYNTQTKNMHATWQ